MPSTGPIRIPFFMLEKFSRLKIFILYNLEFLCISTITTNCQTLFDLCLRPISRFILIIPGSVIKFIFLICVLHKRRSLSAIKVLSSGTLWIKDLQILRASFFSRKISSLFYWKDILTLNSISSQY